MRATLLLSSFLILLIPSYSQLWDPPQSQILLPRLTAGFKKLSNDLGFAKTTPPAVKKEPTPPAVKKEPTPPAVKIEPTRPPAKVERTPPTTAKPVEVFQQSPPTGSPINVPSYKKPAALPEEKPKATPMKNSPANLLPGPSAPPKNNVTSVSKDGTVVFPEDAHKADAAAVITPIVCEKGKAYPPNDPCGKSFDARVVCTDGTSLDENNRCRPNDL